MAIYHCSVRTISRSDNHSAVAAAAYRSGSALRDERTGIAHNYRNRKGIVDAFILLPPNAPETFQDRFTLWNAAESAETRKNSRVAREIILALPHELSEEQRLSLTRDMALFLVSKYGVAVDAAIHAPQEAQGDDPRNHHAHLLFLTRVVKQDGLGEKTRILDDKEQGPQQVELIRQVWETLANAALQQAGFDGVRIDRRTLEAQGIDRIPQEHIGKAGTHGEAPADEEEDKRKKDEEDEDGETDTGKGKAGSGDKSLTLSAAKKDSSSSKGKEVAQKEKPQTRLTLNEEIKQLNQQRVAFSPIPLKEQIKELDRLMDRLDLRTQRLKLLSQKTTLPEQVLRLVSSLFNAGKSLFVVRTKDEAQRTFSDAEREAKAERQRSRYGTTYRAHISERMAEMRDNMETLQTRKVQYQNYKSFVELVERRVEIVRSTLKAPALPIKTEWKMTTAEAVQSKTLIEAKSARERIPIEYRPTLKQESLSKTFVTALKASTSPMAINAVITPAKGATTKTDDPKRPERIATAIPPTDNPKALSDPTVWKVEVNDRGRAALERMHADIRERKAAVPPPTDKGFSYPTKIVTNEAAIEKVRIEAITVRARVPPEFRAHPYSSTESKITTYKTGFSSAWEKAGNPAPEKTRVKMSSAFNSASGSDVPEAGPEPIEPVIKEPS